MQRRVSALARKLWAMAYKAACESAPERYWGATTEAHEFSQPGRQAAWEAVARYVLKVR